MRKSCVLIADVSYMLQALDKPALDGKREPMLIEPNCVLLANKGLRIASSSVGAGSGRW